MIVDVSSKIIALMGKQTNALRIGKEGASKGEDGTEQSNFAVQF